MKNSKITLDYNELRETMGRPVILCDKENNPIKAYMTQVGIKEEFNLTKNELYNLFYYQDSPYEVNDYLVYYYDEFQYMEYLKNGQRTEYEVEQEVIANTPDDILELDSYKQWMKEKIDIIKKYPPLDYRTPYQIRELNVELYTKFLSSSNARDLIEDTMLEGEIAEIERRLNRMEN